MKPIRLFCLLLAAALLCALAACTPNAPVDPTDPDTPDVTGSTEGLSAPIRYEASSIPSIPDLREWLAEARDREQLTNALIYSEQEGGTWHCWLYVGCYAEGDKISVTQTDGVLAITVTAAEPEASGGTTVLYFTLDSAAEPDANITVNGSSEGILLTLADTSLAP